MLPGQFGPQYVGYTYNYCIYSQNIIKLQLFLWHHNILEPFFTKKRPFFSLFFVLFFFAIYMYILGYAILSLVYIVNINNKNHRAGHLFMTPEFFHGCVIVLRPHLYQDPSITSITGSERRDYAIWKGWGGHLADEKSVFGWDTKEFAKCQFLRVSLILHKNRKKELWGIFLSTFLPIWVEFTGCDNFGQ